ncbi:hypothetical protein Mal64_04370 [Pseudobythopirellula maris]|uniref:Uncharacterized protein n=1 Tax=Pseudobythopirellula maris TaxID=2527991 RepID=A0A5C5ZRC9_9BACT|nr:hypothetical protein [Pseudobythopirellula maris]TWT90054.1 hypothetical protein Mal64_04370 [Pseudobythopirellula maris]
MNRYASLSDDYYVNVTLNTEMDLPGSRETILHFAELMQKRYPDMRNFYARDKNEYVLEGDKDPGSYRWCSVEPRRVSSGQVNPETIAGALEQHHLALELAPYELSISPLDCEALDVLVGFDFNYRGNHNQLVAEAFGVSPAMERFASVPGATLVHHEPTVTIAVDEESRVQCRLGVETRTTPYHLRTGEFPEDQVSVYLTARRYGSLDAGVTYADALTDLSRLCFELLDECVIEAVLEPLARKIALD